MRLLAFDGGALYATMGYRFPFYCGAGIALVSVAIAQFVPSRARTEGAALDGLH